MDIKNYKFGNDTQSGASDLHFDKNAKAKRGRLPAIEICLLKRRTT